MRNYAKGIEMTKAHHMRVIAPHNPLKHHAIRPAVLSQEEITRIRNKTMVTPTESGNRAYKDAVEDIKHRLRIESDAMAINILAKGVKLKPEEVYRQLGKRMPRHLIR
jgi:predicted 2-oxoglutarate/Fe(II)-dependent dioxygenase YbiX